VRLAEKSTTDVADAQVVCTAIGHAAAVATSDPDDIASLITADETLDIVPI
jgi:hypothetical protein